MTTLCLCHTFYKSIIAFHFKIQKLGNADSIESVQRSKLNIAVCYATNLFSDCGDQNKLRTFCLSIREYFCKIWDKISGPEPHR